MHVIYIDKKWLDTIGDIKDMILIRSEDGDYFSVLAMEKNMNLSYPFMEAQLIRQMKDGLTTSTFFPPRFQLLLSRASSI